MVNDRWKAGDLVQVESTQKTGWGDECHNHLVLVLRMYKRKRTQHYPLTADLEAEAREKEVVYEVLRDDGKYVKLGLKDYSYPNLTLTNRLVQSSCVEE
jgi:tRNA splicing endonuclease